MTHSRPLAAVVLAAGEGTRMKSSVPKVLHPLCGRPMLLYVIGALEELDLQRIVARQSAPPPDSTAATSAVHPPAITSYSFRERSTEMTRHP